MVSQTCRDTRTRVAEDGGSERRVVVWLGERRKGRDQVAADGEQLNWYHQKLTDSLPGQVCWRDSYLDVDFGASFDTVLDG